MNKGSIKVTLIVLLTFLGCADLKVVRDYANESAKLSAYTDLTARYRDTYRREQPYLALEDDQGEMATDQRRQAAYSDLVKIHQCLSAYMRTLAQLSGEDAFSLSKGIDNLAGSIKQIPELGIRAEHVDAHARIVQVTTRWATSARQERAVQGMIQDGDPHVQKLLSGMRDLIRLYRKTNQHERAKVLGVLEVHIPFTQDAKDVLLNRLARVHLQAKAEEYAQAELKYAGADRALEAMAEGHGKLMAGLDDLSGKDLKASLERIAMDIKSVRENLRKVGE